MAQHISDVDNLIAGHRLRLKSSPPGHFERPKNVIVAGSTLCGLYLRCGSSVALEEALVYSREAVSLWNVSLQFDAVALNLHGTCLVERFKLQRHVRDLDEGIICHMRVLPLRPSGHSERVLTLNCLAGAFLLRFEELGKVEDLVKAMVYSRGGLTCPAPILEVGLTAHEQVASSSYFRFELFGQGHDIIDAVEITRRALALTQPGDNYRPWVLEKYTLYLDVHYRHFGQIKYLDEAEIYCREFIRLCPTGHFHHALASQTLGCHLLTRNQSRKDIALLEEAISLCEASLRLRPPGDINRHAPLKSLAVALRLRFEMHKEEVDLERSVAYGEEAVALCRSGSTPRDASGPLHGLGMSYLLRFEHSGHIEDLHEALKCSLEASRMLGSAAFLTLGNMVTIYRHLYYHRQDPNDLLEATKCGVEALRMSPAGDPGRFVTLNNLAGIMDDHFQYSGKMEYLENAISYCRQALSTRTPGYSEEVLPMLNLTLLLSARFEILGETKDMEESMLMANHALSLCPPGNPSRERCLRVIVISSKRFWTHTRDIVHLDRAVQHARDALPLYTNGSFDHPRSREYLAIVLYERFLETRQSPDLEEAIELYRTALASCSADSYDYGMFHANLAAALSTHFDTSNDMADLDDGIAHYSLADKIIPPENPLKPTLQSGLALAYLKLVPESEATTSNAFNLLESASKSPYASSRTQFDAALRWSLAARARKHHSSMNAFARLLAVLELRLLSKRTVESQQEFLRGIPFRQLSSDAASTAIDSGRLDTAVELLEQGRTMLWSRMRGYRHPISDLRAVDAALAEQFQTLGAQLERTTLAIERSVSFSSTALDNFASSSRSIDTRLQAHRLLSEDWTKTLNRIRQMDGFENFLCTPNFNTLQDVACEGPVIVLNVSAFRCDAIIIPPNGPPHLVPLPESSPALLDRLTGQLAVSLNVEHEHRPKRLVVVLRELWRAIVLPIVENLVSLGIELRSRIWWCPTAQLCALPLHAVGPFKPDQRNLPDLFVSSYTPTLAALMNARARALPESNIEPRIIVIGQPATLPMVQQECHEVQSMGSFVDVLLGPEATTDAVITNLRTHSWAHFACHGHRHPEPFKSAFSLDNGERITVLDIARANLPYAEFAFLSACHAAAPDPDTPDEFVTLAAALQFAGFRGVVSTFWEMADEDGPQVSHDFYTQLFQTETASDSMGAAVALNSAIRLMRKRSVPLHRWVNFIHIGI